MLTGAGYRYLGLDQPRDMAQLPLLEDTPGEGGEAAS